MGEMRAVVLVVCFLWMLCIGCVGALVVVLFFLVDLYRCANRVLDSSIR